MSSEAFAAAEEKLAEALRTGATELDLSCKYGTKDSEKLTELPESLGQLTQLQVLNIARNQLTALSKSLVQLTQLHTLDLSSNQLTALPESLGQLTQLKKLDLSSNQLTALPESLGQLAQLHTLQLSSNQLTALPESLGQLTQLKELEFANNQLTVLPESLGQLTQLELLNLYNNRFQSVPGCLMEMMSLHQLIIGGNKLSNLPNSMTSLEQLEIIRLGSYKPYGNPLGEIPGVVRSFGDLKTLWATSCGLSTIPDWLTELSKLKNLRFEDNNITDIPVALLQLESLEKLDLKDNPLNPELAAAHEQGLDVVKSYLREKAKDQIILNEAKLILIGEGEVGKSCLLDALRDEPWQKHDSTHGIEIKPVLVTHHDDNGSETEITLNTWDFGGQKVYRPTHQFFFSAPAVYLVVWKPREGPQQGAVEYWINTIKHRAGADAKVLIVGTHGGPQQRQPDIDLQDLRDKFGADFVLDAFHVNSRPEHYDEENDTWNGERQGIAELKQTIADVAAALPNVGREVATSWNNVLKNVRRRSQREPYITYNLDLAVS